MQSSQPLVSVVIPCYNHEKFVQDAIQSVIDQTYNNIELIIIDDGSKDSSVVKIEEMIELCERRFTRFEFRSRANIGLSATLNEALEWCQGKYYSVIASDDQMLIDKTSLQVTFLEKNHKYYAVFGGVTLIDENNKKIKNDIGGGKQYSFKEIILHQYNLPAPTQMIRLNVVKELGGYNPDIFIEDWYMWLKISKFGGIYALSEILCLYRKHTHNSSSNFSKMHEGRIAILEDFKDSYYYAESLRKTNWLNKHEEFMVNKNLVLFIELFQINPKKTSLTSVNYFKRYLLKRLIEVLGINK